MSVKQDVTNQKLTERFDNPFNLVNYAITLAKTMVQRGEGIDSNIANDVLDLIVDNRDLLIDDEDEDDIIDVETIEIDATTAV